MLVVPSVEAPDSTRLPADSKLDDAALMLAMLPPLSDALAPLDSVNNDAMLVAALLLTDSTAPPLTVTVGLDKLDSVVVCDAKLAAPLPDALAAAPPLNVVVPPANCSASEPDRPLVANVVLLPMLMLPEPCTVLGMLTVDALLIFNDAPLLIVKLDVDEMVELLVPASVNDAPLPTENTELPPILSLPPIVIEPPLMLAVPLNWPELVATLMLPLLCVRLPTARPSSVTLDPLTLMVPLTVRLLTLTVAAVVIVAEAQLIDDVHDSVPADTDRVPRLLAAPT
jgi:hypothetical protein